MADRPKPNSRIYGTNIGGSMQEVEVVTENTAFAERKETTYICDNGHHLNIQYAMPAWETNTIPATTTCVCHTTAHIIPEHLKYTPPENIWAQRETKNHQEQLVERRTPQELQALLDEALDKLRTRRGTC